MKLEPLARAALTNLRRVVGTSQETVYEDHSYAETPARMLIGWPHWALSLLLPDERQRLFGSHDQLWSCPGWTTTPRGFNSPRLDAGRSLD